MSRTLIGVAALVAGGFAAWAWLSDSNETVGIAVRVAVILVAIWIAYPAFSTVNPRSILIGGLAVLILVFRPRAAVAILPVLALTLGRRRPA
jgi:hypothetical protein